MSDSASEPARESAVPVAASTSNEHKQEHAYRSVRAWAFYLLPAVAGLAGDLWLKAWSFPDGVPIATEAVQIPTGRNPAQLYEPTPVVPHILGFTTIINHGAVFGIFQGYVTFFLAFSMLAMAMILWVFASSRRNQWVVHVALGMITAGALGNLYDRAVHNGVRDMLRFYVRWYPYIFNLADVLLCVGVPLLMLCWLFSKDASQQRGPATP